MGGENGDLHLIVHVYQLDRLYMRESFKEDKNGVDRILMKALLGVQEIGKAFALAMMT